MASLYLPNMIATAAVTELAALHGIARKSGVRFVLADEGEIQEAIRRACLSVLGNEVWLWLPWHKTRSEFAPGVSGIFVGPGEDRPRPLCSEPAAPQVIGADSLPALGGAASHQKESAESGAPHVSPAVQP